MILACFEIFNIQRRCRQLLTSPNPIVTPEQVAQLAENAHVYMTKDGRISMAGLNEHNIEVRSVVRD